MSLPVTRSQALIMTLLALCAALPAHARQAVAIGGAAAVEPVRLVSASVGESIAVDGRLVEESWAAAAVAADFVQQRPAGGAPASLPTEVRVLQDQHAIFVGARLFDPQPDSIIAQLARRDEAVPSDWFWVFLDTFLDHRNAFGFGVNAAGVQRDVRLFEDTREDASWDAVWSAAVQRDADGWTVEMRIPLSELRYVPGAASPEWGVNFRRDIARLDEVATWAPTPQGSARNVSSFGTLALHGPVPLKRDIEVLPYVVSRVEHSPGDADDPWRGVMRTGLSAGADIRMGIGRGLNLAVTVNPDFGQVDADPSQLNLSAFETFLAERRPFFVEGAEVFQLAHPTFPRLLHSRRIGRAPQGAAPAWRCIHGTDAQHAHPRGSEGDGAHRCGLDARPAVCRGGRGADRICATRCDAGYGRDRARDPLCSRARRTRQRRRSDVGRSAPHVDATEHR
jgi:hypothetical protein